MTRSTGLSALDKVLHLYCCVCEEWTWALMHLGAIWCRAMQYGEDDDRWTTIIFCMRGMKFLAHHFPFLGVRRSCSSFA